MGGAAGAPGRVGLSATLLLRGLTLWLRMVPGLVLARREAARPEPAAVPG